MKSGHPADDPRRNFLIRALAMGAYGVSGSTAVSRSVWAQALGKVPGPLPEGRSIYRLRGDVRVNNSPATLESLIKPGDRVTTGSASQAVFVVQSNAFILRSNSQLELEPAEDSTVLRGLRMFAGALLSVFGRRRPPRINTPVATIGIRGTGVYVESEEDRSYICTCYGETELQSATDPSSRETLRTEHHDAPRYILASGNSGELIVPAPFKNHTDEELTLIEALVGREPPFGVFGGGYNAPRRTTY